MQIGITDLTRGTEPRLKGAVVALLALDSVHRGHQAQIASAASMARQLGAPLAVVSFAPAPSAEPERLMTPGQQMRVLGDMGVDLFGILPFDTDMTGGRYEVLVNEVLAQNLAAQRVIIGADFTSSFLERLQAAAGEGYQRCSISIFQDNNASDPERYSCAAARKALRAGRTDIAHQIMGRPFAIEGIVVEGQKLGRLLGFPTANVLAGDYIRPRLGVYATLSRLADGRQLPGVANFGVNPTTGLVDARLEVWLFDFDEDIYGQTLETELIAFLRPELKFDGLPALIEQIGRDADDAAAILSARTRRTALG